jgi:hypothetical protein
MTASGDSSKPWRDPGFSCSHDSDPNPCPSQLSHDIRVAAVEQNRIEMETRLRATKWDETVAQARSLLSTEPTTHAPQAVMVSSFVEGHGFARVEVHFRVGVDLLTDGKIDREKRQALERSVEQEIRAMVIDLKKE